jgi:putative Mg2+ transporter-C (MgtC) family protein
MDFQTQVIFQLILAALLGGLLGLEREYWKKQAGIRTFSLVALGSTLFTILALEGFNSFPGKIDPTRVIQAIAVGIGFIGAGIIFHRGFAIEGLTTAAGLWVAAGIGGAVGAKLYFLAIFCTFLAIFILAGVGEIEKKFFKKEEKSNINLPK